jgi:hypothetical protein
MLIKNYIAVKICAGKWGEEGRADFRMKGKRHGHEIVANREPLGFTPEWDHNTYDAMDCALVR